MARLNGRWKTGQKIMDNLDLLKFKLKEFKQISEICVLYVYDIDFSGQTGVMHIYTKFDKILNETFLNCGFLRDLTISKDRTLLFLANYLLENTKKTTEQVL